MRFEAAQGSPRSPKVADDVQCVRLPYKVGNRCAVTSSAAVYEIQGVLSPSACDRARVAVSELFDAGRTTDRGVSLPTQDVMVSCLPQRSQDEIREALELAASRVSRELPGTTLQFAMTRAFVIVYDAARQRGLKKHTDGRKEGATLLLLISKPQRDFDGGGTRFFPGLLESPFDAKPSLGSTIVFPSDTLQHEGIPIKRGRRLLVCVFATKQKTTDAVPPDTKPTELCHVDAAPEEPDLEVAGGGATARPPLSPTHRPRKKSASGDEQVLAQALQECACVVS